MHLFITIDIKVMGFLKCCLLNVVFVTLKFAKILRFLVYNYKQRFKFLNKTKIV